MSINPNSKLIKKDIKNAAKILKKMKDEKADVQPADQNIISMLPAADQESVNQDYYKWAKFFMAKDCNEVFAQFPIELVYSGKYQSVKLSKYYDVYNTHIYTYTISPEESLVIRSNDSYEIIIKHIIKNTMKIRILNIEPPKMSAIESKYADLRQFIINAKYANIDGYLRVNYPDKEFTYHNVQCAINMILKKLPDIMKKIKRTPENITRYEVQYVLFWRSRRDLLSLRNALGTDEEFNETYKL